MFEEEAYSCSGGDFLFEKKASKRKNLKISG